MKPIYLDWDIGFKDWAKGRNRSFGKRSKGWFKNRLGHLSRVVPLRRVTVRFRRSGSGRVHISVEAGKMMTSDSLLLRTYLDDDLARVQLDIGRWGIGEPINRLFDTKYKNGKIGHAGPWRLWMTWTSEANRGPS